MTVTVPKLTRADKGDVVWIGGPPTDDFKGGYATRPATPWWYRNLDPSSEAKAFYRRIEGLETKFKRNDPNFGLQAFADSALQHMELHGMDTVFYMEGVDATTGIGGAELFTGHSRYTKETIDEFVQKKLTDGVYDSYHKEALQQSALWLINSLDESLKQSLRHTIRERPYGPSLWMAIVDEVLPDSLLRADEQIKKFEALTLAHFKGENVRDYAMAVQEILAPLETSGDLPKTHLKTIVDRLCECSVMDFKIIWMGNRPKIHKFISEATGKDESIQKAMPNYWHWTTVLREAKNDYQNLMKQWGPAKTGPSPEAQTAALVSKLSAQVANLSQQLNAKSANSNNGGNGNNNGRKDVKCYECGKPGYTKKTCPDCLAKKNNSNGGSQSNGNGNSNGNSNNSNGSNGNGSGKWAAPKDGEPQEKVIDGVTHKCCKACRGGKGRWTRGQSMHSTAEHRGKTSNNDSNNNNSNGSGSAKLCELPNQTLFSAWADTFSIV